MRTIALLGLLLLSACSSVAPIIGIATGAVAGGASANPVVGFAVGVGTTAAADAGIKYITRRWHRSEQDRIAELAGTLPPGRATVWRIRHSLPIGNEHGQLAVVRDIPTPLTHCKEILFSVQDDAERWFTASVCQQGAGWKWAAAEPAVDRWGYLQ